MTDGYIMLQNSSNKRDLLLNFHYLRDSCDLDRETTACSSLGNWELSN